MTTLDDRPQARSLPRLPIIDPASPPPGPADDATAAQLLAMAAENLIRLGWALDGFPAEAWRRELDPAHYNMSPSAAAPASAAFAGPRGRTPLDLLCYARDEEAFVIGRRLMRLWQEMRPEFEHLTWELATAAAKVPYAEERPAAAFSELFKNRMAWIQLAEGEAAALATRRGLLPPEEGGGDVGVVDLLRAVAGRDRALHALFVAAKAAR